MTVRDMFYASEKAEAPKRLRRRFSALSFLRLDYTTVFEFLQHKPFDGILPLSSYFDIFRHKFRSFGSKSAVK